MELDDVNDCPFCKIIEGTAPATIVDRARWGIVIEPLGPYVPGHLLFIPYEHAPSAIARHVLTGQTFEQAAAWALANGVKQANIMVSVGESATQTVPHLHVHLLPRGPQDGLPRDWPWMRPEKAEPEPAAWPHDEEDDRQAALRGVIEGLAEAERMGAPTGWFIFGEHAGRDDVRLEFSQERDEVGMPRWERPIDVSTER